MMPLIIAAYAVAAVMPIWVVCWVAFDMLRRVIRSRRKR